MRAPTLLVLALAVGLVPGCDSASGPSPLRNGTGLLRVTAIEVVVMESYPPQVHARVSGEVPTVCTEVQPARRERDGRTITLTITYCETSQACILLLPPPVELTVPLDGPFDTGEYLLRVNGVEHAFRI